MMESIDKAIQLAEIVLMVAGALFAVGLGVIWFKYLQKKVKEWFDNFSEN